MAPTTGILPATGISAPWATTRYGQASCGPTAPRGRAGSRTTKPASSWAARRSIRRRRSGVGHSTVPGTRSTRNGWAASKAGASGWAVVRTANVSGGRRRHNSQRYVWMPPTLGGKSLVTSRCLMRLRYRSSFLDARLRFIRRLEGRLGRFIRRLEGRLGRFIRRLEGRLGRLRDGPNLHAMLASPGPETALPVLLIERLLPFTLPFRLLLALPELRIEAQGEVGDTSGGDGEPEAHQPVRDHPQGCRLHRRPVGRE